MKIDTIIFLLIFLTSCTGNQNYEYKEHENMNPVRFEESDELLICGSSAGDVGTAWQKWENNDSDNEIKHGLAYDANSNPGAFEARFYPNEGEFDFVGV